MFAVTPRSSTNGFRPVTAKPYRKALRYGFVVIVIRASLQRSGAHSPLMFSKKQPQSPGQAHAVRRYRRTGAIYANLEVIFSVALILDRSPGRGRWARLRVIVVDGSHKEALALCAHLSFVGIECRAVFGTVDAIDVGRGWVPHAIVMDVSIAQYDGIDAVRMLRNDPRTCGIAIIAYTALNETDVRRRLTGVKLDGQACHRTEGATRLPRHGHRCGNCATRRPVRSHRPGGRM